MRVLSLDVGDRRIGVAIADPTGTVASPLTAIVRGTREEDFSAIAQLVSEHRAGLVVVGLPLGLNGSESEQARTISRYAGALRARVSVPVVLWDERFTTAEAEEVLLKTRGPRERRRARRSGDLDAIAAALILQSYLDSERAGSGDQGGQC
jgi:putative Holliday junction resolvase